MVFLLKSVIRCITAGVGVLMLVLLLIACGDSHTRADSNKSNVNARNMSSSSKSLSSAARPMLTATPNVVFKTYTGSTFKTDYPQDWKTTSSTTDVAFTEPAGNYNMTIGFTSNPKGAATPDQLAEGGISGAKTNLKNAQMIEMPATTMIDGQTWSERAVTGTNTVNGQSANVEVVVLATNRPKANADTKGYLIVYVALKKNFDAGTNRYFTPMLKSFHFVS